MITLRTRLNTFTYRVIGAAVLDRGAFEEIEHDPSATLQSAVVVVASSLAAGVGASALARPAVLLGVAGVALITWIAWATLILQIGGRVLAEQQTRVDLGQLLRTIGFAASPGLLQVLGAFPSITVPIFIASWLWMLSAMTLAVRQALDFHGLGRAFVVCVVALGVVLATGFLLALLLARVAI